MSKATGIASIAEGRSDIHRVNPRLLQIEPGWNVRDFNDPDTIEHVDMLAQSIAEKGVEEPITVVWKDGKAFIRNGECRFRATIRAIEHYKAEIKTVPVKAEDRYASPEDQLLSQFTRNSGKPFTSMEMGVLFKRLLGHGWQAVDIAKKAGISPARVSQILDLQTMPTQVKAMVSAGQVSASLAAKTVKEHNPQVAVQILQDAVAEATANGASKVKPSHVEAAAPKPPAKTGTVDLKTVIKEAFEASDIDNSGSGDVVITMPNNQWELIRQLLKL